MSSTATTVTAADQPQQRISDFGRVIGVLTSPGETFKDIVRKPKWLLPVIISTVIGIGFAFTMNSRIDWKAYIKGRIEQSPRAEQMTAQQINDAAEMQARFSPPFAWVIGICGPILGAVILGLIYWGIFNVLGGAGTNFKTSMSIAAHSAMTGLISGPLLILVMWLRPYGESDPETMVVTAVQNFLPHDAPAWLQSIGGSLEIFWIWTMVLVAIGFSTTNPKKLSVGKACGILFSVWFVWVFIKASVAAVFA